jgi:mRNA interferase MazF
MTMLSSTPYSAGDVVRVAFVFTNQAGTKVRPAVILSSTRYHSSRVDLIMMPLSTRAGGYFGDRALVDWQTAGLPGPSVLKAVIQTIPQSSILSRFGRLGVRDIQQVKDALADIIGLP